MRSPEITRLYLQVATRRGHRELVRRPDLGGAPRRGWKPTTGWRLNEGPVTREGDHADAQLRLRTDAARPTVPSRRCRAHRAADRRQGNESRGGRRPRARSRAGRHLSAARTDLLDSYSADLPAAVWRAEHFSWWMTSMLHRFPGDDGFQQRLQRAQLRLHRRLARCRDVARRELRRPAAGLKRRLPASGTRRIPSPAPRSASSPTRHGGMRGRAVRP